MDLLITMIHCMDPDCSVVLKRSCMIFHFHNNLHVFQHLVLIYTRKSWLLDTNFGGDGWCYMIWFMPILKFIFHLFTSERPHDAMSDKWTIQSHDKWVIIINNVDGNWVTHWMDYIVNPTKWFFIVHSVQDWESPG